jgi:pyruvate/2-oxoglutarate dehydrogenase complex dihydrolipoamide dehydrogenase (E3) component
MVERARPGGECTFTGCVPSKTLLETARRVAAATRGTAYGFDANLVDGHPAGGGAVVLRSHRHDGAARAPTRPRELIGGEAVLRHATRQAWP